MPPVEEIPDELAAEAEELDGYFSDAPLDPQPEYPPLNKHLDSAVILLNLPKVGTNRLDKLTKVVIKLVSKIGDLQVTDDFEGVVMPVKDETTLGFCLVNFQTPEAAKNAVEVLQDYKFDKNHSLTVALYERAKQLQNVSTGEFKEPEPAPFQERPNAAAWLEDANQRDQLVLRYGKETEVHWFDAKNDPVIDYDGSREKEAGVAWCDYYCHWSPAGSYLATLVPPKGVILWSGPEYEKVGRFVARKFKAVYSSRSIAVLCGPGISKISHLP
jgi:translation initiation factor 3 subunit B